MKKLQTLFIVSVLLISLGSMSFMLMPLSVQLAYSTNRLSLLINGLAFWIPYIVGYLIFWLLYRQWKKLDHSKEGKIGIIVFFSSRIATFFDCLMMLSFICLILLVILGVTQSITVYIDLSLLALSINMHAMFNGRIYKYIVQNKCQTQMRRGKHNDY